MILCELLCHAYIKSQNEISKIDCLEYMYMYMGVTLCWIRPRYDTYFAFHKRKRFYNSIFFLNASSFDAWKNVSVNVQSHLLYLSTKRLILC